MTWTKISDDYGEENRDLSDAAFRTHTEALVWTMKRLTGGYVESRDVRRFAESPHAEMAVDELVACGWWSVERQGYRIHAHMQHQAEPEVVVRRKELNAERQRKHRRKKAGLEEGASETPAPLNASSRPDQTRPDQRHASDNAARNAVTAEDAESWPPVRGVAQ